MHNFIPLADEAATDPGTALTVKNWIRKELKLDPEVIITLTEARCVDPGCPLVETHITVFEPTRTRHWKLTRPQMAITQLAVLQTLRTPPKVNCIGPITSP